MYCVIQGGGVAQMVERSLSMREVPGSIPGHCWYIEPRNREKSLTLI